MKTVIVQISLVALILGLFLACASQPVAQNDPANKERISTEALQAFAAQIRTMVEAHAWTNFLDLCDAAHKDQQLGFGMDSPQYIAEILGLHDQGNSIVEEGELIKSSHLDQIKIFEAKDLALGAEGATINGTVTLNDGRTLKISLVIIMTPKGLRLSGAVG